MLRQVLQLRLLQQMQKFVQWLLHLYQSAFL
jgi:hypothetical protein